MKIRMNFKYQYNMCWFYYTEIEIMFIHGNFVELFYLVLFMNYL